MYGPARSALSPPRPMILSLMSYGMLLSNAIRCGNPRLTAQLLYCPTASTMGGIALPNTHHAGFQR